MIRGRQKLTMAQLESIWAGAYLNNFHPDGSLDYIVIDLNGESIATVGDTVSALRCCMSNHLDSTVITWADVARRKKEAQYRREHGLPARTLWETVEGVWLSEQ